MQMCLIADVLDKQVLGESSSSLVKVSPLAFAEPPQKQ
jgi:hypothetical protein